MTAEQQWNIDIAEFTKQWKDCRVVAGIAGDWDDIVGKPIMDDGTWGDTEDSIPFYSSDLNAIHEVENSLNRKQFYIYLRSLKYILNPQGVNSTKAKNRKIVNATAKQKALALFVMIDVWKNN